MNKYPKKVPPSWHTALRFLHSAAIHGVFTRVGRRVLWGLAGWWSETLEERGYSMHSNAPCNVTCVANKSGRRSRTAVVGTPLSLLNPNVLGRWGGTAETDQCEHKLPPVLRCTTLQSLTLASDNQGHPDTCSHRGKTLQCLPPASRHSCILRFLSCKGPDHQGQQSVFDAGKTERPCVEAEAVGVAPCSQVQAS